MEIRGRGIIKNKIAYALYNTFLSSMVVAGNGTCKPKDFKRYVKGYLDTDSDLGKEDIQIFYDIFLPDANGSYELIFKIYVKNSVISDTRLSCYTGNVLDNLLVIIDDCMTVENVNNNLYGCAISSNLTIKPNNKFEYCGVTMTYTVHDR